MPRKKFLNKGQKELFAIKATDLGNLIFIGLVIGQFVPGSNRLSLVLGLSGILSLIIAYTLAYYLTKGK